MTEEGIESLNLIRQFLKGLCKIDECVSFGIVATDSIGKTVVLRGGRIMEVYGALEYAHRSVWMELYRSKNPGKAEK